MPWDWESTNDELDAIALSRFLKGAARAIKAREKAEHDAAIRKWERHPRTRLSHWLQRQSDRVRLPRPDAGA